MGTRQSFYAHPGTARGNAAHFAHCALDCVLTCETKLLIVDDLHFLRWRNSVGVEISNHFKYIANEFPVTLTFVGVGLAARGLFSEGHSYEDAVIAQIARRTTKLDMRPFAIDTDEGRREWRQLLLTLEKRIVLAEKHPGMLADHLSDYLFARSTGHIGSLMTLINRGCQRAVRPTHYPNQTSHLDQVGPKFVTMLGPNHLTKRAQTMLVHSHFRLRHRNTGPTCTSRGLVCTQPFDLLERSPHSGQIPTHCAAVRTCTTRVPSCRRCTGSTTTPSRSSSSELPSTMVRVPCPGCLKNTQLTGARAPNQSPTRHDVGQHQTPIKCAEPQIEESHDGRRTPRHWI